eukprot:768082-Hanusia_phi.AAC.7
MQDAPGTSMRASTRRESEGGGEEESGGQEQGSDCLHPRLISRQLFAMVYTKFRSAARASRLLTNGASRNFSGTSTKDIDSMNETELRAMVRKLMGASANKPSSLTCCVVGPAIMGAPENYVARPTKGEATSAGDEHSSLTKAARENHVNLGADITIVELKKMYSKNIPITMATAYDFPSAVHVDLAGIDVEVTERISVPTIGIGAGIHTRSEGTGGNEVDIVCSGQVLVYHDLLGMMQHPHHAKVTPKFCKQFR